MYKLDIKHYVDSMFDNINQFAKAAKIEQPTAKKLYEGNTSRISFDVLYSLCQVFHCTPNDILINDDPNPLLAKYNTGTQKLNVKDSSIIKQLDPMLVNELEASLHAAAVKTIFKYLNKEGDAE